jgi:hypothetical protein
MTPDLHPIAAILAALADADLCALVETANGVP